MTDAFELSVDIMPNDVRLLHASDICIEEALELARIRIMNRSDVGCHYVIKLTPNTVRRA